MLSLKCKEYMIMGSAPRLVRLVTAVVLRSHKMIGSRVARVVLLDLAAQAVANAGAWT